MAINSFLLCLVLSLSVSELEVISVSPTSISLSFTLGEPAPAVVFYGTDPDNLDSARPISNRTRFHLVRIDGLEPDRDYFLRVGAFNQEKPASWLPPLQVRTLRPPPGGRLFSFAVMNDIHAGQDINSLMVLPLVPPLTPGFVWKYPVDNYWSFTLRAAADEINQTDAAFTIVNGDLTSWFLEKEFRLAKDHLDRLRMPYYVTRGNHDRQGEEPEDWFKVVFGLDPTWRAVEHGGCRFLLLDDNNPRNGLASLTTEQLDWLERELDGHPSTPAFIVSHHPWRAGSPDMRPDERARLLEMIKRSRQVVAVIGGHSHRAAVLRLPGGGGPPFIEVPSVAEYMVGYGRFEVYEGGFTYTFEQLSCPDCREWNHETRRAYFGFAPQKIAGKLGDRSFSEVFPEGIKAAP